MILLDSSGWLEYLSDGPNADAFSPALENLDDVLVPSIILYEVVKVVMRERDESAAMKTAALLQQGRSVEVGEEVALLAASLSLQTGLPMADSMILATARLHRAEVWTQDSHFAGLPDVRYIESPSKGSRK